MQPKRLIKLIIIRYIYRERDYNSVDGCDCCCVVCSSADLGIIFFLKSYNKIN